VSAPNDREKWVAAAGYRLDPEDVDPDRPGRRELRRLDIASFLLTACRIDPARVRRVPARAIAEEGSDDEGCFALLDCPCGARPIVHAALERCPDCERYYVLAGPAAVYVCYGAMTPPELRLSRS
jgi:hypothetical protein